jgi:TetR/AcrR family transcriptional regulator
MTSSSSTTPPTPQSTPPSPSPSAPGPASTRRIAGPNSKNRVVLLDAAERVMIAEGHAAVTSRRVAAEAGLKPQLVHYYFATMDDLFLAVFRRRAEVGLERQAAALSSADPMRALWQFSLDPAGTALTTELNSLANHRKAIRAEIAQVAEQLRAMQAASIAEVFAAAGVDASAFPPDAISLLLTSVSRVISMEKALGMSSGHDDAIALVERFIGNLDTAPHHPATPAPHHHPAT